MSVENSRSDERKISDDCLSSAISSSTLEIMVDEPSSNNTDDDDFPNQTRESEAGTTNDEEMNYRKKKQLPLRNPKSHRLIEKRRRDRMNAYLTELLQLIPHESPQNQRRIEKTEIIEMAIKHIRHILSSLERKSETDRSTLDTYRTGYENALVDIHDFLDEFSDSEQLLTSVTQFLKEKEIDIKALTDMPDKKRPKHTALPDKRPKLSPAASLSPSDPIGSGPTLLDKDEDRLCVISEVTENKHSDSQSFANDRPKRSEQSDPSVKVPVFVLHPSGTHYIPMCIAASLVSHAFERRTNLTHSSSVAEQVQCHPVSIPVNFSPPMGLSDPYELDIQNINVIGTRHQTSVRPN